MSKNAKSNKVSQKSSGGSPIPYPQQVFHEELAVVDDDVLSNMQRSLTDAIAKVNGHNLNPVPWEVELCYVQRELQIRAVRREAHAKYLSSLSSGEVD